MKQLLVTSFLPHITMTVQMLTRPDNQTVLQESTISLLIFLNSMKRATVPNKPRFLTNVWHFFDTITKEPNIKTTRRATYQSQCLSYVHFDVQLLC